VRFEETAHYSGAGLAAAHNLAIDESSGFGYVTGSLTCGGGLHAVDLRSPQAPVFAGCADQDGYVHDAQCLSYAGPDAEFQGREVCFAFAEDTLSIFDVTDEAAPSLLARSSYPGVGYTHQGWTTEDGIFLLMGDEGDETLFGHGLRTYVWDVSRLRTPLLIGTHTSDVFATDHNRYVVGGLLYLSAYTGGFRVYDLAGVGEARLVELAYFDVVPGTEVASRLGAIGVYPYFPSGVVALTATRQGLFLLDVQAR
jgi:choice-of-anchor B domain-containing protein